MRFFMRKPPSGALVLLLTCVVACFESQFASGRLLLHSLVVGDVLSASTNDVVLSPNGRLAVGFFPGAQNGFHFGCWFTDQVSYHYNNASKVVWIANRRPGSSMSRAEWDGGQLFTVHSGGVKLWGVERSSTKAELLNSGNFVLYDERSANPTISVFESFSMPLDTLLPGQVFQPSQVLTPFSTDPSRAGVYSLKYHRDGNLGLWAHNITNYWLSQTPNVDIQEPETNYAMLDDRGTFTITNIRGPSGVYNKSVTDSDAATGATRLQLMRRLTLDSNGNLILYAQTGRAWTQVWAAIWPGCIPDRSLSTTTDCRIGAPGRRLETEPEKGSRSFPVRMLIIVSSASILGPILVLAVLFLCWLARQRRKARRKLQPQLPTSTTALNRADSLASVKRSQRTSGFDIDTITEEPSSGEYSGEKPRSFTYEEIETATRIEVSTDWTPTAVKVLRRLVVVFQRWLSMGSKPPSVENYGVNSPKFEIGSNGYNVVQEQIETGNNFKLSVSNLLISMRELLKRIRINDSQCNRLVDRIAGVIKELEVHESILEGKDLANVQGCFLILLTRSRSLVAECGGSEWVETALIRADNKEAFEEVHKELTKFLCKYAANSKSTGGSTSCNGASPSSMAFPVEEDAESDCQDLLVKLLRYEEDCAQSKSSVGPSLNLDQPAVVQHLGKIIQVVSDKSKDKGSIPAGEEGSSASYLQIHRSEIILKMLIGTGSYGEVHKAEWLGCKVCCKDFPWSGGYGEQWLVQAKRMLRLRHPNVLQLVGFSPSSLAGNSKPQPKVLTEIMQGDIRSLIDRMMAKKNGKDSPFKWCTTLDIMIQVARGLDCMHTNGFMHGDRVLTTNIIIKVSGGYIVARIGDFGVPVDVPVKYVHVFEPRMGDPEGAETARWMAPEVCVRAALYSPASDIYSFGIFCYEVLTGRKPFDHYADVVAIYAQILTGNLRPELPGDLDERVADIIKSCWHADPSSRPKARAVVDALEATQFPVIAK